MYVKLTLNSDGSPIYVKCEAIEVMQPVTTGGTIITRGKGGVTHVRQTVEQIMRGQRLYWGEK